MVGETESNTDLDSLTIDELFGGGKTDPADKKEEAKDLFGGILNEFSVKICFRNVIQNLFTFFGIKYKCWLIS